MMEVVIADSGIRPDPGRQNTDVRIRFPVDYLEYPWETRSGTRQDAELFRLKLDESPIPWPERRGKTLDQLPPIAAVLVKGGPSFGWWLDDYIAKVTLKEPTPISPATLPTIPSDIEDLRRIPGRDLKMVSHLDHYVSFSADRFDDLFVCFPRRQGQFTQCSYGFQYRSLFVRGYYCAGHDLAFAGSDFDDTVVFTGGIGAFAPGGLGQDTVVFSGLVSDYLLSGEGDCFTVANAAGGDSFRFSQFEAMRFGGGAALSLASAMAAFHHKPGDTWLQPEALGTLFAPPGIAA